MSNVISIGKLKEQERASSDCERAFANAQEFITEKAGHINGVLVVITIEKEVYHSVEAANVLEQLGLIEYIKQTAYHSIGRSA